MGNKYNSINEQIRRIKTLFTEERLYGNIVEQVKIKDGSKGDPYQYKEENGKYYYAKKGDSNWKEQTSSKGIDAIKTKVIDNDNIPLKTNTDTKSNAETTGGGGEEVNKLDKLDVKKDNQLSTEKIDVKDIELQGVEEKIKNTEGDSVDYYNTEKKDGKTVITNRKSFEEIKKLLGDENNPIIEKSDYKAGRDVDYVLIKVIGDDNKLKEIYIKGNFEPITRGEKRKEISGIKKDVRKDKGEINKNERECKDHLRRHYKEWKAGSNKATEDEDIISTTEFCVNTFYNRYENNEKIMNLIDTLKDEKIITIEKVSGGVEKETYEIKTNDRGGKLIGTVKKLKGNQYRFDGEKNFTAIDKVGNRLEFKDAFKERIQKTLNLDPNTNKIVVIKTNKNRNNGIFRVN